MKISRAIWIAVALLLLWLLLSWLLGDWIDLRTPALYYLRGGLWIIGIIGFVGFLLLRPKTADGEQSGVSAGELDDNFNEASKRLQPSGVKQMAGLPAVFFLGDTDTAKTSVIAKSDIAQLLAGQAQQEVSIVPTRAVNFWIARSTVFIDPAGALLADPANRKRLFKKFSAVALKSVMGSRRLPARSVVFTVDCGTLMQNGGADALALKARQFQTILAELAQEIGARFPVYVLFTKADKLSYFRDFVENLTETEAADVLGVTLPLDTQQGVYHQQQTARLNEAFQQLYYSLADRRTAYLSREHKPAALPNIYEFPREFNKLRPLLTSFLVDLCRPSQLGLSPFLRGFYFTGIRAVTVNDVAPAALQVPLDDSGMDSGATRMFSPRDRAVPLAPEIRDTGARKLPQWVYLSQFLPGVILADGTANSVGHANVKLNVARRVLLGVATGVALLMALWWTVSFSNNRALIHDALDAAQGAPSVPSLDALQRLTKLKETLEKLNYFEDHGRPLSYGAFLYSGDDARESVKKAYYGLFRKWLLAPTQERLVKVCSQPSDARPKDFFYDALKAYLITTEFHDKSGWELLTPRLLMHWEKQEAIDGQTEKLARQNFDFYSRELLKQNDYLPKTTANADAVGNCRDYLNRFGQTDRIYRAMLADASGSGKPLIFNVDYAGTEATVVNRYPVEPQFTKTGFNTFQNSLKNLGKYSSGEDWVLGPKSAENLDKTKLRLELQRLYKDDFIKTWLEYLQKTRVKVPYSGPPDAVAKLDQLISSQSALLKALCVAGENTGVNKEISEAFQSVQYIAPTTCVQSPVGDAVKPYMNQLVNLDEALKTVGPLDKAKPEDIAAAKKVALDAETTVKNIALNFGGQDSESVSRILKEPIWSPVPPPPQGPNSLAANMCANIAPMLQKYPFKPSSNQDATLEELNKFLKKPEGLLWTVVNSDVMKPYLAQLGDGFSAATGVEYPARPQFITFLNKAARLSHVLYAREGGQAPGFTFTMKPVPSPDVEHFTLKINGQTLSTDGHSGTSAEFPWPGNKEGVDLKVRFVGGSDFTVPQSPGLWGIWHFMDLGHDISAQEFEWVQRIGPRAVTVGPENHPAAVHFVIDSAAAPVLRPRFFSLVCESKATQP